MILGSKENHYPFPSKASEYATSFILLGWALLIYVTDGQGLNQARAPLENIMPIQWWAALFLVFSTARVALLFINGRLRRSPHLRSACSFISCFAWFQVTIAFFLGDQTTMDLAVYPVLLALDFYNAYRIAVEARITDEGYPDAGTS